MNDARGTQKPQIPHYSAVDWNKWTFLRSRDPARAFRCLNFIETEDFRRRNHIHLAGYYAPNGVGVVWFARALGFEKLKTPLEKPALFIRNPYGVSRKARRGGKHVDTSSPLGDTHEAPQSPNTKPTKSSNTEPTKSSKTSPRQRQNTCESQRENDNTNRAKRLERAQRLSTPDPRNSLRFPAMPECTPCARARYARVHPLRAPARSGGNSGGPAGASSGQTC